MSMKAKEKIAAGLRDAIAHAKLRPNSSPIERAAREMCINDMLDPDSSLGGDGQNLLWVEYAETKIKPVLRSIREPSASMRERGAEQLFAAAADDWGDDAAKIWRAMIDEALNERKMMQVQVGSSLKDDLLSGVERIAEYIGEDKQVTGRLIRGGLLPAFKRGRKIYARRSEIDAAFSSSTHPMKPE